MSESQISRTQSQPCMGMDINTMYKIATRENAAWGIEGYQVPKKNHDHIKARKQKEINEQIKKGKKPGWPAVKATKKGNFLDDEVKMHNPLHPQPNKLPSQYKLQDPWVMKEDTKRKYAQKNKVNPKADKHNYIDQIFKQGQKDKFPAPNAYNTIKTQKQIEEENAKLKSKVVKYGDLPNYLNDYEWQGNQNPGPGNYNAKQTTKDTFEWNNNKKFLTGNVYYSIEPKKWIEKHNKKKPKSDMSKIDPYPVSYDTFGKMAFSAKNGEKKTNVKNWGTTKRFNTLKEDMEKNKKLNRTNVPGSGQYNLLSKWPESKPGEKNKIKSKTVLFNYDKLTKGTESTRSIYY